MSRVKREVEPADKQVIAASKESSTATHGAKERPAKVKARSRRRRANSLPSRSAEKPVRVKPDNASTERPSPGGRGPKKGTRVVPRRPAFVPNERRALCFLKKRRRRGRRRPEGAREPRGRRDRRRRRRSCPRGRPREVPRTEGSPQRGHEGHSEASAIREAWIRRGAE